MNWLDIVIGLFLLLAFFNGYRKGLVMQLIGLAAILLAAVFGGKLAGMIVPELDAIFNMTPQVLLVLSYVIAFAAIFLVAILVGQIIERIVDFVLLGFFNRLFGSIVAAATTVVALSLLLNLVLILDINEQIIDSRVQNESFFFERVQSVVPSIVPFLNKEFWNELIPEKYNDEEIE
jgi:membrane protein required for colicin V production